MFPLFLYIIAKQKYLQQPYYWYTILNTAKKLYIHCIADSISHVYTFYLGTFLNSNKMAQKIKNNQCKLREFVNYLPIHWNLVYPALFYSELPFNRNDDWKNWESLATTIKLYLQQSLCEVTVLAALQYKAKLSSGPHQQWSQLFSQTRPLQLGHSLCLTSAVLNRRISIVFCNQNNIVTKCNAITYSHANKFNRFLTEV